MGFKCNGDLFKCDVMKGTIETYVWDPKYVEWAEKMTDLSICDVMLFCLVGWITGLYYMNNLWKNINRNKRHMI